MSKLMTYKRALEILNANYDKVTEECVRDSVDYIDADPYEAHIDHTLDFEVLKALVTWMEYKQELDDVH